MRYYANARFNGLLRLAFEEALAEGGSQKAVCEAAGLSRQRMSISRWYDQEGEAITPLKEAIALKLWDYLSPMYVERAIAKQEDTSFFRKSLFSEGNFADVIMCFFAVYERHNRNLPTLSGKFIGYKNSFLYREVNSNKRMVVRSIFNVILVDNSYFKIAERQASSEDIDHARKYENSTGIAFVKSGKFWMVLREDGHDKPSDQPRIFCFSQMDAYEGYRRTLKGYMIEASSIERDTFFHSPIWLMPIEREIERYKEVVNDDFVEDKYVTIEYRDNIRSFWPEIVDFLDGVNVPWESK